jgi:hypothetical protein
MSTDLDLVVLLPESSPRRSFAKLRSHTVYSKHLGSNEEPGISFAVCHCTSCSRVMATN